MPSRRSFLHAVAFTAAGAVTRSSPVTEAHAATSVSHNIRRNINTLDPAGPEVAALRAGVKAMKNLNAAGGTSTNPRSWGYQRGIHRHPSAPTPLPAGWNTCIHHNGPGPGFLSWHRAYLYHFERICRAASGDPTFTLPYWNYDFPGQSMVPAVFLENEPPGSNSLYHASRDANDGLALDPAAIGAQATIATAAFAAFEGALEGCHDNTHVAIGGSMGSVSTSPLDPIFYLHHCNIDRCWRHWQLSHVGSGIDPTPLPAWWTTAWTFFDGDTQVQMTGQQAEHTTNLEYVYDDEPRKWPPWRRRRIVPLIRNICERYPFLCRPIEIRLERPWPITVDGRTPVSLPVRMPPDGLRALVDAKREAAGALDAGLLSLELVVEWAEGSPILVAEARPAGRRGGWLRAGAASGFSRTSERDTVRMDVTPLLSRLDREALARELEWRVRFISGRLSADGSEAPFPANLRARARIFAARLTIPEATRR